MTGDQPGASPINSTHGPRWILLVVWVVIGLVIGVSCTQSNGGGPTGDCIRPDTTLAYRGVTQGYCQKQCSSCRWQQS